MSDQNEMKSSENPEEANQEHEVGILAVEPCCANGCILTDAANGCSVAEGFNTTASGFASHAEGSGTQSSEKTPTQKDKIRQQAMQAIQRKV
ncbi:MAG: hypothetical protein ACQEWV_28140 [Bacillota bacterium]